MKNISKCANLKIDCHETIVHFSLWLFLVYGDFITASIPVMLQINVSTFALLFSEMVQYCQNRVSTVPELQNK